MKAADAPCEVTPTPLLIKENKVKLELAERINFGILPNISLSRWELGKYRRLASAQYQKSNGEYGPLLNFWPNAAKMDASTIVTGFWSNDLSNINARKEWFQRVLLINAPMVVYVSPEIEQFVIANRPKRYKTVVIKLPFEELHLNEYADKISFNQNSHHFASNFQNQNPNIESIITSFSKLELLSEAAVVNPFGSKTFVWMSSDTGKSVAGFNIDRLWSGTHFDEKKLNIQALKDNLSKLNDAKLELQKSTETFLLTEIVGGGPEIILQVSKDAQALIKRWLDLGAVASDSILMTELLLQNPSRFNLFCKEAGDITSDKFLTWASTSEGEWSEVCQLK